MFVGNSSSKLQIEIADEFLRLGHALAFEISLGFANKKGPLVFVLCKDLCEHEDGKQSHIKNVFIGTRCQRVCKCIQGLSHCSVLGLPFFEAACKEWCLISAPVPCGVLDRYQSLEPWLACRDWNELLWWSSYSWQWIRLRRFDFLILRHVQIVALIHLVITLALFDATSQLYHLWLWRTIKSCQSRFHVINICRLSFHGHVCATAYHTHTFHWCRLGHAHHLFLLWCRLSLVHPHWCRVFHATLHHIHLWL